MSFKHQILLIFKYFQQIRKKIQHHTKHISGWIWFLGACPVSGLSGSHILSSVLFLVLSPHLPVSEITLFSLACMPSA